ncbi:MAG: hypothetical protein IM613_12035 [Cytophagales bacterium]|jgi:hypothetical protein|nr:hypothetical protein [Cytophagales bacterium]
MNTSLYNQHLDNLQEQIEVLKNLYFESAKQVAAIKGKQAVRLYHPPYEMGDAGSVSVALVKCATPLENYSYTEYELRRKLGATDFEFEF